MWGFNLKVFEPDRGLISDLLSNEEVVRRNSELGAFVLGTECVLTWAQPSNETP